MEQHKQKRKRNKKGLVNIGGWKDFPKSWPLLTQPGCKEKLKDLCSNGSSAFPLDTVPDSDPLWEPELLHHSALGACRKTRADLLVSCWHLNNSTRKARAQENSSCTDFCCDHSTNQTITLASINALGQKRRNSTYLTSSCPVIQPLVFKIIWWALCLCERSPTTKASVQHL